MGSLPWTKVNIHPSILHPPISLYGIANKNLRKTNHQSHLNPKKYEKGKPSISIQKNLRKTNSFSIQYPPSYSYPWSLLSISQSCLLFRKGHSLETSGIEFMKRDDHYFDERTETGISIKSYYINFVGRNCTRN